MSTEFNNRRPSITSQRLKEILLELAETNLNCEENKEYISVSGVEKVRNKLAS